MLKLKRIYTDVEEEDGYRILVDRLWPRGIKKELAQLDYWAKEIAPSETVRKYFNHEEDKFADFKNLYLKELDINERGQEFLELVMSQLEKGNVTLLYGAKNESNNQGIVLKEWLIKNMERS